MLLLLETVLLVLRVILLVLFPISSSLGVGGGSSPSDSAMASLDAFALLASISILGRSFLTGSPRETSGSSGLTSWGGTTGAGAWFWAPRPMRAAFNLARTRAASASRSDAANFTAMVAMVRGLGGGGPLRRGSFEDEGGGLGGLDGFGRTGERVRAVLAVLEVLGERDRLFLEFGGERARGLAVVVDLDRVMGAAGFPSFFVEALGADAVLLAGCTAAFDGGAGFAVAAGEVSISGLVVSGLVVFFFF